MSKGLDALKELKTILKSLGFTRCEEWMQLIIIEKALERLEELERAFDSLSKENEKVMKELSKEIEKNRGLEIIKNKITNKDSSEVFHTFYEDLKGEFHIVLTQKEYDLLKEVCL